MKPFLIVLFFALFSPAYPQKGTITDFDLFGDTAFSVEYKYDGIDSGVVKRTGELIDYHIKNGKIKKKKTTKYRRDITEQETKVITEEIIE